MKILLIGNYAPDRQYSMLGFANALQAGLCERGVEVRTLSPRLAAGKLRVPKMGKWLGYADKLLLFPAELRRAAKWADVVHICDQGNAMYTRYLTNKPHLVTCHDLLAIRSAMGELADWKTGKSGKHFQAMIVNGLKHAEYIACDSQTTYQDLLRIIGTPAAKVSVISMGSFHGYLRLPESQSEILLQKTQIPLKSPFLLHVGGNPPYKNRLAVLKIFNLIIKGHGTVKTNLVMAGNPLTDEMIYFINKNKLSNYVIEICNPNNQQINALYSRAEALIFPSLYEGFGLPIIEAQACGCPVFTSNRAPMTEVGGLAAQYFDPEKPEEAAKVICANWDNLAYMREIGYTNAGKYTLDLMINNYISLYKNIKIGTYPKENQ